jgi:BirA family transcriptional regulator, biotin operon repressor / biotin---[acetyl-CoA-carboxylase] ligase
VRRAGIDTTPVWLHRTGSTNDDARRLAEDGAPAWTLVAAGHQTAGRGRLGRSWTDAPGKALLVSLVLRPRFPPGVAPLITLAAAAALVEAAELPELRSKWPNDLVVGERKVGGILAETAISAGALRHVILGIGLNVAMSPEDFPPEVRESASSVVLPGDVGHLLTAFLARFRPMYEALPQGVVERYRAVCATIGRRVRATTVAGDAVEGLAIGVDRGGGLLLETSGSTRTISFSEVKHLG